ncbi:MAG: GMC family oxidoreductase N-terminal domain-containing protein [Octadecabacter sp.]|nr:GMC family oxidoreductase N-terminal domain-containing protein [Octadecabacter sp.]
MAETFDHIVIGGGSSGCVATSRLVEAGKKVLLLEAGYHHRHPYLDMPPGVFKLLKNGSKFFKTHKSVPQEHLNGRQSEIPQGNVLGGGSSVNGQAYVRGRPSDYDEWDEILRGNNDAIGWDWEQVLPHFKRLEGNRKFNDDLHGAEGKLVVSDPGYIDDMARWFVQALQAQGEPFNPDFNGKTQRGAGYFQFTYNQGQRVSAAYAFIEPLMKSKNKNLTLRLESAVQRIIIENDRAVGVVYKDKAGKTHEVRTTGEVILSSGALITPKLLMLSGLGPADHLRKHGINVIADLPGVGQNLKDHPDVSIVARANGPYGYWKQDRGWNMLRNGIEFKLFGRGKITTTGLEAATFLNPTDPEAPPTHEAYCIPVMYLDDDKLKEIGDGYGMSIQIVLLKPHSVGEVTLASGNPDDMPRISPNFLKDPRDMEEMVKGLRYFRETMGMKPLADKLAEIVAPNPGDFSDEGLKEHCRQFVKTNYHPAGTAKMGADGDSMAVLDSRLRVRGIEGLRVCDMSAVPEIPAGNTNAPAMMIGDRCADLVLGIL